MVCLFALRLKANLGFGEDESLRFCRDCSISFNLCPSPFQDAIRETAIDPFNTHELALPLIIAWQKARSISQLLSQLDYVQGYLF